ncbi:hypothetical protein IFM61392_03857 [Aspergillus lentulus]|uniref:Uncharacterized protein n=1 Tax=Aspergillus lentulus TaxID=293939 RepID=A0ABQ0ZWS9_ASPLE|nr:hypothetical protein IFM47457_01598 [Aspergillus lentulus]GFF67483.1 hypothetical protein IFM60648_02278 [Aspergillus lentulus]GFG05485.1 hypothetical protein IFM61392_03857 [Aspergillus lentulus]
MVEQSFTNRYIDEQKLLALLRARFPRKTYTVQIKMGIWYISAPQSLTQVGWLLTCNIGRDESLMTGRR